MSVYLGTPSGFGRQLHLSRASPLSLSLPRIHGRQLSSKLPLLYSAHFSKRKDINNAPNYKTSFKEGLTCIRKPIYPLHCPGTSSDSASCTTIGPPHQCTSPQASFVPFSHVHRASSPCTARQTLHRQPLGRFRQQMLQDEGQTRCAACGCTRGAWR